MTWRRKSWKIISVCRIYLAWVWVSTRRSDGQCVWINWVEDDETNATGRGFHNQANKGPSDKLMTGGNQPGLVGGFLNPCGLERAGARQNLNLYTIETPTNFPLVGECQFLGIRFPSWDLNVVEGLVFRLLQEKQFGSKSIRPEWGAILHGALR